MKKDNIIVSECNPQFDIMTDEELRIVALYEQLGTYAAVGEIIGRSPTYVGKILRRLGKSHGHPQTKVTNEELIEDCKTLSRKEIAKKHNMNVHCVDQRLKKLGISAVIKSKYATEYDHDYSETVNTLTNGKFSLIERLGEKRYLVRCNDCGTEQKRTLDKRQPNQWCKCCADKERELKKVRAQLINCLKLVSEIQKPKECSVCGTVFYSQYKTQKYCCDECRRKANNKKWNRKDWERVKDKSLYIDSDITLIRLYKRDHGRCWICGGKTNWNDWSISDNGNKYPGATYPVRDHVIPLARGGEHSWENVRLAHWECNANKADTLYPFDPIPKEVVYSERAKSKRKKTAQYTLDGNLVKIYDSTAEVTRELGIPSKTIQNACRGQYNGNKAHGYRWEYVG